MINNIEAILKRLNLDYIGRYDNHSYVIEIPNSDEYAKVYTKLSKNAINTEFPNFETNTNKVTTKIITYFTLDEENITYNLFLIADFNEDHYYLKIREK